MMNGAENMNILTLKFFDDNFIIYEYQPEGIGQKGVISYDRNTDKFSIEKSAEGDNGVYARMAQAKIADIIGKKSLPIECVQAWY